MCLQLMTLDTDLASFFNVLDETGIDYAVVLTADHGGLDVPERLRLKGIADAARVEPGAKHAGVGKEIASRLGLADPFFTGARYISPPVPEVRHPIVSAHPGNPALV